MTTIPLTEFLETIGQNLHSIRNAKKQTLQCVASYIGTSHSVLSKIENGRYPTLKIDLLLKLCNYYDVSLLHVFNLDKFDILDINSIQPASQDKTNPQKLIDGYLMCIEQYRVQVEFLREIAADYLHNKDTTFTSSEINI